GVNVALEYRAVPSCPDVSDFKTQVSTRLGRDPFLGIADKRVLLLIASSDDALEGRLIWLDHAGNWAGDQNFPPRKGDCHELTLAMSAALAVQIQLLTPSPSSSSSASMLSGEAAHASAATRGAEPATPPAPPSKPTPMDENPTLVPVRENDSTASAKAAFSLGAGISAGFGLSTRALPLPRVFGRVVWPSASLELAGEMASSSSRPRADGAAFSQSVLLVGVAGCGVYHPWSACLVAKGGSVRVEGHGLDLPASSSGALLQTGLRLGVSQRLGARAYLDARAEGLVNLATWSVTLDHEPVWVAPRFTQTIGVDFGVLFP
ncbi:MAG: hypothetical protein ABIQ16_04950, partial [Polyangiaceae bacterium]